MMNLYEYTYDLVRQIPSGKISTYGAVAEALGDIRAARAVGRMMNQNPDADDMPCFKIVQSDGHIGGFGLGLPDKIRRLHDDNIEVEKDLIIDFDKVFFNDFKTDYPLKKFRQKQIDESSKVSTIDKLKEDDIEIIAGFDVAYRFDDDWADNCVACILYDYKKHEVIDSEILFQKMMFPYIPTYLAFREFPFIKELMNKIKQNPSVLMVDGNGILHPFKFGIASYVGVSLNIPTIGVAKSLLCGKEQHDHYIQYDDEILGFALYANKKVKKPLFVSPGHMISLETSVKIVKKISKFKQPEPLRLAHNLATESLRKHR